MFWRCVQDGTDFSEFMIYPSDKRKTHPPPFIVSSNEEDYAHTVVCTAPKWDELLALEITSFVAIAVHGKYATWVGSHVPKRRYGMQCHGQFGWSDCIGWRWHCNNVHNEDDDEKMRGWILKKN